MEIVIDFCKKIFIDFGYVEFIFEDFLVVSGM